MRIAICPGSFDPLTNGHLDVIQRATKLFDRVVVAVAHNEVKKPCFTLQERMKLAAEAVKHLPTVEVDSFDTLLVDFVERRGAHAIVRGLRAVSDFEMPKDTYTYLSSRMIKEIARLGGDVTQFVPPHIKAALQRKFKPS
jgi:pantetheine-phosphate adenylyltransferase